VKFARTRRLGEIFFIYEPGMGFYRFCSSLALLLLLTIMQMLFEISFARKQDMCVLVRSAALVNAFMSCKGFFEVYR